MAVKTRTITTRIDDLGGAGKAEPVTLSLNGRTIQIDLNKRNKETLERHLEKYFAAGEEILNAVPIREWAVENGFKIGVRGRISKEIEAAFLKAQEAEKA